MFVFIALSVSAANVIDITNGNYAKGRYIYFPDDDNGNLHLVDLQEPIDEAAIAEYTRNPDSDAYLLFTRNNPLIEEAILFGDEDSIRQSNFNKKKEVIVIVHGWRGKGKNTMSLMLTEAFLEADDCNIIVFDWSTLANRNYVTARYGVATVGKSLGEFLRWLTTLGISYDKMHLVGFSLGGHLIGNAGREVNGNIKRITALDPAGPLWSNSEDRINQTDARYVEVIHTNTGLYGYTDPCGDVDYYPNGGTNMPGCWMSSCSHSKAYEYMAATVKYDHLIGNMCDTFRDITGNICEGDPLPMGNRDINKKGSGIFRVNTASTYPF